MDLSRISVGPNVPQEINIITEVPMGGEPVKYEFDKAAGAIVVDRIIHTSMRYPCNYGFIPHTLGADGDPLDVLVAAGVPFIPGSVATVRPVGVLMMEDDKGGDEKLLCVPVDRLHPYYTNVDCYSDLPPILIEQITHFFAHYKDLEDGKWVRIQGWEGVETAERLILEAIERARSAK